MDFTFTIPAKPYVRATVYRLFGEPANISPASNFGKYFNLLLEDDNRNYDSMYKGYADEIKVVIPEHTFNHRGYALTRTNVINFNNFVEDYIKRELFLYIDALIDASTLKFFNLSRFTTIQAIEIAQEKFGFSEETFNVEAIRKAYYRYRKRKAFDIK